MDEATSRATNTPTHTPFFYWKEYPERDVEFVRWYPCVLEPLDETRIWTPKPIVVYVHVPFCNNLCHSCLYNKMRAHGQVVMDYVAALKREAANYAARPYIQASECVSAYFGGGTPTALPTPVLKDLIAHVYETLNIKRAIHATIETTPLDIDQEKARMLADIGIARVSIGVQTFDDELLSRIGRTHTAEKAIRVIAALRSAGINEINLDLMFGLPGQSLDQWRTDLAQLLSLAVNSVSVYQYIVLPSSRLFTRIAQGLVPPCPPRKTIDEMQDCAVDTLLASGYVATTVNDFGHDPDRNPASANNDGIEGIDLGPQGYRAVVASTFPKTVYLAHAWDNCGEILALGAGAYGYLKNYTYLNDPQIDGYINRTNRGELPIVMGAPVSPEERMARNMVMGIKLLRVSRNEFKARHGVDLASVYHEPIRKLIEQGLVRLTEDALEVTYPKGWYYMDNISKAFYSPANYRMPQPAPTNTALLQFIRH